MPPWDDNAKDVNPWPELSDLDWDYVFDYNMDHQRKDIAEIVALYKKGAFATAACLAIFRLKGGTYMTAPYMTVQALKPYNGGPIYFKYYSSAQEALNSLPAYDRELLLQDMKTRQISDTSEDRFSTIEGLF